MLFRLFSSLSHEQQRFALGTLPETIRLFSDLVGIEAALDLSDAFGGSEVAFPKVFDADRGLSFELSEIIGKDAARVLFDNYQGEVVYIPCCNKFSRNVRNITIAREFDRLTLTMSGRRAVLELVRRFCVSNRTIEKIVSNPLVIPMVDNFPEKV